MNKGLEALERVKKYYPFGVNELEYLNIEIIETALKRLEEIEDKYYKTIEGKGIPSPNYDKVKPSKLKTIIKKQDEILQIIKEKMVDVQLLKDSKNFNEYNWCVHTKDRALTQAEFDLLKEHFKWHY